MSVALINPQIIKWARQRSQIPMDILAKKASVKLDQIKDWEDGKHPPTFRQAQKLAQLLHVPFGFLYLQTPPRDQVEIPDLRTIKPGHPKEISVDFKDVLSDVLRKYDWFKEYLQDQGLPGPSFVGRYSMNSSPKDVAEDIVITLNLSITDRKKGNSGEYFLKQMMDQAELAGVWVMRTGKVGNNTTRILDPEEFRGFAISDPTAPLVFINGADAKGAQLFTLVHELAHIWLGSSGISNVGVAKKPDQDQKLERFCDQVAAEVLVPESPLVNRWSTQEPLALQAETLATQFGVSPVVIGRRALDLNLISSNEFFEFYGVQSAKWKKIKEEKGTGQGSFYSTLPVSNGRRYTQAVLQQVQSQKLLLTEGAKLLGVNLGSLYKLLDGLPK